MSSSTDYPLPPDSVAAALRQGTVIPAHPLALTDKRRLDERHQRALTRYYLDAGAGGLAVGVHITEFAIHDPGVGLYRPVLELAMETARTWQPGPRGTRNPVMIAGIIGRTEQAVREAELVRALGYHAGLLGLGALKDADDAELVRHARRVAAVLPIVGFYLQPSVGGRILSERFWRELAEIPNLLAIKIAPFNRYYTLAVVRAVAAAGRAGEVALYTGNDDSIIIDLLTDYEVNLAGKIIRLGMVGGLLGHWAYWTGSAVEQLGRVRQAKAEGLVPAELLTLAAQVTESNEAVFDPQNSFRGCISGILYVLHSNGLAAGVYPLGKQERLSPGQAEKIDRVTAAYFHLTDSSFVEKNLDRWLA